MKSAARLITSIVVRTVDVESVRSLPQHELHFGQGPPPDARVPGLQFGDALVQEVDQVRVDGLQDRDWGHGIEVSEKTVKDELKERRKNADSWCLVARICKSSCLRGGGLF